MSISFTKVAPMKFSTVCGLSAEHDHTERMCLAWLQQGFARVNVVSDVAPSSIRWGDDVMIEELGDDENRLVVDHNVGPSAAPLIQNKSENDSVVCDTTCTTPVGALPANIVDNGNVYDMDRRSNEAEKMKHTIDDAIAQLERANCVDQRSQADPSAQTIKEKNADTKQNKNNNSKQPQRPETDKTSDDTDTRPCVDVLGRATYNRLMYTETRDTSLYGKFKRYVCSKLVSTKGCVTAGFVQGNTVRYEMEPLHNKTMRFKEYYLLNLIKVDYKWVQEHPETHDVTGHEAYREVMTYLGLLDTLYLQHLPRRVDANLLRYMYSYTLRLLEGHEAGDYNNVWVMNTVEVAYQALLKKQFDMPLVLGRKTANCDESFAVRLN